LNTEDNNHASNYTFSQIPQPLNHLAQRTHHWQVAQADASRWSADWTLSSHDNVSFATVLSVGIGLPHYLGTALRKSPTNTLYVL